MFLNQNFRIAPLITHSVSQCKKVMNAASWKHLRAIMADINDFNTDVLKWHSERNEPLMQVPAITVRTLKD